MSKKDYLVPRRSTWTRKLTEVPHVQCCRSGGVFVGEGEGEWDYMIPRTITLTRKPT
jgi:hypothetical protein